MLAYKSFVFGCFPFLFLYLCYIDIRDKEKKFVVCALATLIINAIGSIMTQFYGVVTTASDVAEHMQKHVSWPVDLGIIH